MPNEAAFRLLLDGAMAVVSDAATVDLEPLRAMPGLRYVTFDTRTVAADALRLVAGLRQIDALSFAGDALTRDQIALLDALPPGAVIGASVAEEDRPTWEEFRRRRRARVARLAPERRREAAERLARGLAAVRGHRYDSTQKAVEVAYNDASDEDLRLLRWLPEMEKLQFHRAWGITTAALRHLAGHPGLKAIDLNGVKFTAPLRPLARCPALESLDFFPDEETEATDAHTVGLERMTGLKRLSSSEGRFGDRTLGRIGHLAALRYLKFSVGPIQGDDSLRPLAGLRHLEYLELSSGTPLSTECLRHLAGLDRLCSLNLGNLSTGDGDGLRHLAGLKHLEYLTLWGEGITDAALMHLHTLTNLRVIRLVCDRVTRKGVIALAESLPNAAVHWHEELFRSPRPLVRFRRQAVGGFASALIPAHWRSESSGGDSGLVWSEDGYGDYDSERLGEAGVIGSGLIQLWVEEVSLKTTSAAFLRECSRAGSDRLPKRFETGVVEGAGDGVATAAYPQDGNSCLAAAAVCGAQGAAVQCEAEPQEFKAFRGMFAFVVSSLRVGPGALVEEEVDVPSSQLV